MTGSSLGQSPEIFFVRLLTATRFRPPAQGWRFGYPGIRDEQSFNRKAVASPLHQVKTAATALRLGIDEILYLG